MQKTFEDCVDDIVKNLMNKNYFPQVCKINVSETATVSETTKGLETTKISVTVSTDSGIVVSNSAQSVFSFVPIWGIPLLLLVLMAII